MVHQADPLCKAILALLKVIYVRPKVGPVAAAIAESAVLPPSMQPHMPFTVDWAVKCAFALLKLETLKDIMGGCLSVLFCGFLVAGQCELLPHI